MTERLIRRSTRLIEWIVLCLLLAFIISAFSGCATVKSLFGDNAAQAEVYMDEAKNVVKDVASLASDGNVSIDEVVAIVNAAQRIRVIALELKALIDPKVTQAKRDEIEAKLKELRDKLKVLQSGLKA